MDDNVLWPHGWGGAEPLEAWRPDDEGWPPDGSPPPGVDIPADPGFGPHPSALHGRLLKLVLVDGVLVHIEREPVYGSGYERAARELREPRPVALPRAPEPAAHDRQLAWLARIAGGPVALAALDTAPLTGEAGDLSTVAARVRSRTSAVAEAVDGPLTLLGGDELAIAGRRLLIAAAAAVPGVLGTGATEATTTAAAGYAVLRANALTGSGRPVGAREFRDAFGVSSIPQYPARRFAAAVCGGEFGQIEVDRCYGAAPDVWALGRADLLIGRFREHVIGLRDVALELRARAVAS